MATASIPADPDDRPRKKKRVAVTDEPLVDKRAVLIGLVVAAMATGVALVWRMSSSGDTLKKPAEFQFSVAEPKPEDLQVPDPQRDILKEKQEQLEKQDQVLQEEKPDLHQTTNPVDEPTPQEVVKTPNLDITNPKIDLQAKDVDIQDTPPEILQVSEQVNFAPNVIAADSAAPADLFKYKEPSPRDKPVLHHIAMAPRPSKTLSALPKAFGDQDVKINAPLGSANANLFGTGEFFRPRDLSGGIKARTAVDSALHWLAMHQDPDGSWKCETYEGQAQGSLACTALGALAFMGAGHNTRRGEYRRNVVKAIEFIAKQQEASGHFKWPGSNLYTHAICTIAMCEAYGRANDDALQAGAQKAIDYSAKAVGPEGGWRYEPGAQPADMSVTGWFIQAFKAAKLAHMKFDQSLFANALIYVDNLTNAGASKDSTGIVGYTYEADQNYDFNSSHSGGKPAVTGASMVIRQFNGMGIKNTLLIKGAEAIRKYAPEWKQKDFYYWYYATYAMHNMGGEDRVWWNQRLRDVLLEYQVREGDNAGSWDPKGDHWAAQGGRVYTTALGALCLEVYYRYSEALNSFGTAPELDELFLQQNR